LATMQGMVKSEEPSAVIIDPISNLESVGSQFDIASMLIRLIDFLKANGITALLTNLTAANGALERTDVGMSSVMDTWILLRDIELGGERNRGIYVLKSRGMPHSNQIREFLITSKGIDLVNVYLGPEGVLTGSARVAQEESERIKQEFSRAESERRRAASERRKKALQAQIAALQAELEGEDQATSLDSSEETSRLAGLDRIRNEMSRLRNNGRQAAVGFKEEKE
jgi:circadian clock protein KaiC